jgi:hypothetical protein
LVTAKKSKSTKDLTAWLTRTQIVDMLCVSYETVKNWERRGLLHPEVSKLHGKTTQPVLVYDPQELASLPQYKRHMAQRSSVPDPGERTARAFELFDRGATIRQVVIELRLTVAHAEALLEQWRDVGERAGKAPTDENKPIVSVVAESKE